MKRELLVWALPVFLVALVVAKSDERDLPRSEFKARRSLMMDRLPDGIVLLHARSALVNNDQLMGHGFHQDASFYYFTGLSNAVSSILAIDGPRKESWLFVPTELSGMAALVKNPFVQIGANSESMLQIEHVVDWKALVSYVDRRRRENPQVVLYTDDTGAFMFSPSPESNPPGLARVDDPLLLWRDALAARWPGATIKSASEVIRQMRLVKSNAEIQVMRRVGAASAEALTAGLKSIRPGKPQRYIESEIVRACIEAGGEGPSFWPLAATGTNSAIPGYLEALADYRHMNRLMTAGDLTHLDLGCDVDHYGGDVGRTVPVSGHFSPEQREIWDLLVQAYFAGVSAMHNGATREEVFSRALASIRSYQEHLQTVAAKSAAEYLLSSQGTSAWYLHSSGVECCETEPKTLRLGMVVVFEPSITLNGQGYYLEDMILITSAGHEILTVGLPYTADEIERLLSTETRTQHAQ